MKTWRTERRALVDLKPASYNPRKIAEGAFDKLGGSLERFGLLVPLVWNERTGNLVSGHQRYRWLVEQGEDEAEVVVVDLDDKEEVALNITLNNKAVRGNFTDEVREALAKTEVRIGSAFNDIGLDDLRTALGSTGNSKQPGSDPNPNSSNGTPPSGDAGDGGNPPDPEPEAPEALIVCPECGSKWKMKNNEVVHNAVAKQVEDAPGQSD